MGLIDKVKKLLGISVKDIEHSSIPTKAQYFCNLYKIQHDELSTDRFKKTYSFMNNFYNRDNIDIEEKLFYIIDKWHQYNDNFEKGVTYEKICTQCLGDFRNIESSLTYEQQNSNAYLNIFVQLMNNSKHDCKFILEEIKNNINREHVSTFERHFGEIEVNIPSQSLEAIPLSVSAETVIPYYNPSVYKFAYVNRLDNSNIHIYEDYNEYVRNVEKLAVLINLLMLQELLLECSSDIKLRHLTILNNEMDRKFVVSYDICTKNIENIQTYKIGFKTMAAIARVTGIPFEQIISMSSDDLEKYINEIVENKKSNDEVRTIQDANEETRQTSSDKQLVLK